MIRFATLVARGTPTPDAYARYAAEVGPNEAATARTLLTGIRPKRIASADVLLAWVAEATQTPAFLMAACLAATPDKSEVASLLLPAAEGLPPTLTQTLTDLRPDTYLHLARRLPPQARLILNRLATGTFRIKLAAPAPTLQTPGTCLAILTMIDPSVPEATLALPLGNALVPLCKLRLTLPETAEILSWVRANTTDRFGPLRQVTPSLVFELAFDGLIANLRRKSGIELLNARLTQWQRHATTDMAARLPLTQAPAAPQE